MLGLGTWDTNPLLPLLNTRQPVGARMKPYPDPIVAFRQFVDGSMRPVYDDGKRQYAINDDGDRVYGVFFIPRNEGKKEEKPSDPSDRTIKCRFASE